MSTASILHSFTAMGITIYRTPTGALSAKPKRLVTPEVLAQLKASKSNLEALFPIQDTPAPAEASDTPAPLPSAEEVAAPSLRLLDPAETRTPTPPGPAPVLAVVEGHQTKPLYGIVDGVWEGPGIDALPWGRCCSCGWDGPLMTQGTEGQCALCWQADGRRAGQAYRCETFCEHELEMPLRFEPGGILSCPDCTAKILQIKERAAQRVRPTNAEMQQSG